MLFPRRRIVWRERAAEITGIVRISPAHQRPPDLAPTAGPDWQNDRYQHLQFTMGPGSYSLSISGDCGHSCPAGLGIRVDSGAPEPAAWALMLGGFGLAGAALRRRALHPAPRG